MSPGTGLKHGDKFDGKGFFGWKFEIRLGLIQHKVWKCVDPGGVKEETISKDMKSGVENDQSMEDLAYTFIMLSLSDSVQAVVRDCKTAMETWTRLEETYGGRDIQDRMELRDKLRSIKMKESGRLLDHVAGLFDLVAQLRSAGGDLPDEEIVLTLLRSLPKKFGSVKAIIRTRMSGGKVDVEEVKNALFAEERNLLAEAEEDAEEHSVYNVRSTEKKCFSCKQWGHISSRCPKFTNRDGRKLCFKCKSPEHFERDCPMNKKTGWDKSISESGKLKRYDDKKRVSKGGYKTNYVAAKKADFEELFMVEDESFGKLDWLLDSGATQHMCNNKEFFDELVKSEDSTIFVANGDEVRVEGTGAITLQVMEEYGNISDTRIENVLYSPRLSKNLLSVSRLAESGARVIYSGNKAEVIKEGRIILTAVGKDKLYKIKMLKPSRVAAHTVENKNFYYDADINVWHRRLGHISAEALKRTIPIKGELKPCAVCACSNFPRKAFKPTNYSEKEKLECVYTDICGPMRTTTFSGARYFVLFVDGYTKMVKAYLMKQKGELSSILQDFVANVERQTGVKLKKIRCDNGGEYTSSSVKTFCKHKGIELQYTSPYTSQQNGVCERFIRTITGMTRAMLKDANFKNEYWSEALKTAVFLKNRISMKSLGWKSPYERWFGEQPKLKNLRIFGSVSYVRIPSCHRSKLENQGVRAKFLGYDITTKNYRLEGEESGKVLKSRDVKFFENVDAIILAQEGGGTIRDSNTECSEDNLSEVDDSLKHEGDIPVIDDNIDNNISSDDYERGTNHSSYQTPQQSPIVAKEADNLENIVISGESCEISGDERKGEYVSKRGRKMMKPINYATLLVQEGKEVLYESVEPKSYEEAIKAEKRAEWEESMNEEIANLLKNNTWELAHVPKDRKLIGCKWIYKIKRGPDGEITRYKSRLVAKGYSQIQGLDFNETYSPVASYTTIRTVLAIAASLNINIQQYDFECAYLNGKLKEDENIYMELPKGYLKGEEYKGKALKLKKCIYGLRQSGRNWNDELDEAMNQCGLQRCRVDRCVYIRRTEKQFTIVLIYVHDMLILSNEDMYNVAIIKKLKDKFIMKELGQLNHFLGIKINKQNGYLTLSQEALIDRALEKFNMSDCRGVNTPGESREIEDTQDRELTAEVPFRSAVGCLLYIATTTRPDIMFTIARLSRFVDKAKESHWRQLKRVMRYLKETKSAKLAYKLGEPVILTCYADADFGSSSSDRKSVSGFVGKICGGAVSWYARSQKVVALSTMEAEYISLANATQEAIYINQLLEELLKVDRKLTIQVDNQSCIAYCGNEKGPGRAKHISIKYHFVKDLVESKRLKLEYVASEKNVADVMTKALAKGKHVTAVELLGLKVENAKNNFRGEC